MAIYLAIMISVAFFLKLLSYVTIYFCVEGRPCSLNNTMLAGMRKIKKTALLPLKLHLLFKGPQVQYIFLFSIPKTYSQISLHIISVKLTLCNTADPLSGS